MFCGVQLGGAAPCVHVLFLSQDVCTGQRQKWRGYPKERKRALKAKGRFGYLLNPLCTGVSRGLPRHHRRVLPKIELGGFSVEVRGLGGI